MYQPIKIIIKFSFLVLFISISTQKAFSESKLNPQKVNSYKDLPRVTNETQEQKEVSQLLSQIEGFWLKLQTLQNLTSYKAQKKSIQDEFKSLNQESENKIKSFSKLKDQSLLFEIAYQITLLEIFFDLDQNNLKESCYDAEYEVQDLLLEEKSVDLKEIKTIEKLLSFECSLQ